MGKAAAPIEAAALGPRHGTLIEFPLLDDPSDGHAFEEDEIGALLIVEAVYAPLSVSFAGERLPRLDFLEHAAEVTVVDGVAVGVYDDAGWHRRTQGDEGISARRRRRPGLPHMPLPYGDMGFVNFYGHVAATPEAVEVGADEDTWRALWEVREGAALRLTLPSRDSVIEDDAWRSLMDRTRLALCRVAARAPSHRHSMSDVAFARAHGLNVPDPALLLRPWVPPLPLGPRRRASETGRHLFSGDEAKGCVILPGELDASASCALLSALRRMRRPPPVAFADPRLEGHADYDSLPRIVDVTVRLEFADGERWSTRLLGPEEDWDWGGQELRELLLHHGAYHGGSAMRAESIQVSFRVARREDAPGNSVRHGPIRIPVLVGGHGHGYARMVGVVHSPTLTVGKVDECAIEVLAAVMQAGSLPEGFDMRRFTLDLRESLLSWAVGGPQLRLEGALDEVERVLEAVGGALVGSPVQTVVVEPDEESEWDEDAFQVSVTTAEGACSVLSYQRRVEDDEDVDEDDDEEDEDE